jgi:glycosyltransferase involved in cell wall biosynthesis
MDAGTNLAVSVVMATRNRPEHAAQCVASILANREIPFELLVIDQSDTTASHDVIGEAGADARLRWIMTDSRGLSVARNVGVSLARAPIVAFTDDDCRVPPNWVRSIFELFASDPKLCLLFGAVTVRPEDRAKGFAASFMPKGVRELRGRIPAMRAPWGIGANMAILRSAFEVIGMFDPGLGAGTTLFAGEEFDMTIRALAAGLKVVETPHIGVLHLGVRSGKDASRLMRGYGVGFGAAFIKHVRLGTPGSLLALMEFFVLHVCRSLVKALRGQPTPGFGLLAGILAGVCRSSMRSLGEVPRSPGVCDHREGPFAPR